MPRIGLSETWSLIPEGVHVFKITRTNYDEKFGKLETRKSLWDATSVAP